MAVVSGMMTSTAGAEPITAPGKSSTPHSGPTWHSPKEKSTLHACSPYLGGEKRVVSDFVAAWVTVMELDRFDLA